MKNALMVRSASGELIEEFKSGIVAIGWVEVVMHYENFDSDGKSLIPLTRIYWPAE